MNLTTINKSWFFLKTVAAVSTVTACVAPSIAIAEDLPSVNWRMQALWDAGTTPYEYEEKFVERVSELTDGKFEIRLFAGGQLVPAAQAFEAVRAGAFQMMKTFDGYEAGSIPAFAFTSTVRLVFLSLTSTKLGSMRKGELSWLVRPMRQLVSTTLHLRFMGKNPSILNFLSNLWMIWMAKKAVSLAWPAR